MADWEHLMICANECAKSVRWKASVQNFEINKLRWISELQREILNGTYKSKGFKKFDINERGKIRHIQSVHISERVVQKSLCNYVLKPVVDKYIIYDNSASQKGKGTEFALDRLKVHLRRHYARHGLEGGILTMDYHDYFGQIPHKMMIKMIEELLPDDTANIFIEKFINCFSGDKGLGLGSEISQMCAILFPTKLDKFIDSRSNDYARYMDDSYAIHNDVNVLNDLLKEIKVKCKECGIILNENKTYIHRFAIEDFEYLKKRIHLEKNGKIVMRLSRKNIYSQIRYISEMKNDVINNVRPLKSMEQSYQSWRGYAKNYNCYKTIGMMDRLYSKNRKEIKENGSK